MKVAVYSGSFDPLHIGHLAIMRFLTKETDFDCIYLIVSPQNPFKDPSKADNARMRYEAAVAAAARHPELKVRVDNIEMDMDPPHYTLRTLEALKAREPENEFTLVIGADNLDCFMKWHRAKTILSKFGVVVYPRSGYDMKMIRKQILADHPDNQFKIQLVDAPILNISSTQIREAAARGEDISGLLM